MAQANHTSRAVRQYLVLGGMYVAQGIVYGFATFVLLPTLAAAGVQLEVQAGILALAGLPWVLKLGWAIVLDRVRRRRVGRPQVALTVAMLGVAICLAAMARVVHLSEELGALTRLWFLLNVALSLQDVATDAFALDNVAPAHRGLANGVMLGGHHIGLEGIGGLALGAVVSRFDLQAALLLQAAVVAALAVLPWIVPSVAPPASVPTVSWATIWRIITHPRTRIGGLVAVVTLFADQMTYAVNGVFFVEHLGWSVEKIYTVLPPATLVANIVGYFGAAALTDRIGHSRALAFGCLGLGLCWVGFALLEPFWGADAVLVAVIVVQAMVSALMYVGLHAFLMDLVDLRVRATGFAVMMALVNLSRVIAPPAAPGLLGVFGFAGLFLISGVYQGAVAGLVFFLRRHPALNSSFAVK